MSRTTWISLAVLLIIALVSLLLIDNKNTQANATTRDMSSQEHLQDFKYQENITAVKNKKKSQKKSETDDDVDPYKNEVLKAQLQQVSDLYSDNIKYPITSQPITNAEDVRDYEPFEQAEVDLPFPDGSDDKNPIRLVAATDKYQYFQGDIVSLRVQIQHLPESTFTQVQSVISGARGDLPTQINFHPNNDTLTEFIATFDTKVAPINLLTQEMLAKITVNIDGRILQTTIVFKYALASAQVTGVQQSQPQGPNLVMPIQVNVFQSGYYFINAILQDATTGKPLIQLQEEKRLNRGNGVIELKAHIAALIQQGSEGPYILKSIKLFKGAEENEQFDAPGSTTQPQFTIPGFPFSSYEYEEYIDELAQERLAFLRDIADLNDAEEPLE